MCGAILTSPFDVVKTRLQSDLFRHKHAAVGVMGSSSTVVMGAPRTTGLLYNFVETGGIIRYVLHKSFHLMFHILFSLGTSTGKNHYELYSKA